MIKIYETDSYRKSCETLVTSCKEIDGKYYIELEESIFFPEEGGQRADSGVIKTADKCVRVLDGKIAKGNISYLVDAYLEPGEKVICELDWESRYMRMQQHSAEHIMSGQIFKRYGYTNVGFHLSDTGFVTMDVSGPLSLEQVYEIEAIANSVIRSNLPVRILFPGSEELATISYRSKIEIDGQVRLVAIGEAGNEADICACCAPHVDRTGEIGLVCVTGAISYKGGTRISILAGERALTYIRRQQNLLQDISRELTTSPEEVMTVIKKQSAELIQLKQTLAGLKEQVLAGSLEAISDRRKILFTDMELPGSTVKKLLERFSEESELICIFSGDDEKGYSYSMMSKEIPVIPVQKLLAERLNAKGGGREPLVSGKVSSKKIEIEQIFNEI